MQRFRVLGGLHRFTSVFSAVRNLFVPPRSRHSALATHPHGLTLWEARFKLFTGIDKTDVPALVEPKHPL